MPSSRVFWIQRPALSISLTEQQLSELRLLLADVAFARKRAYPRREDAFLHAPVDSIISDLADVFSTASFGLEANLADVTSTAELLASSANLVGVTAASFSRTKIQRFLGSDGSGIGALIFAPPVPGSGQASLAQYLWEDLDDPVRKNDVSSAEALTGSSGKEYLFVPGDIIRVLVTVALPTDSFNLNYEVELVAA